MSVKVSWFSSWNHFFAAVDIDGYIEKWRFDGKDPRITPEAWLFEIPEEAKPDDGMFIHDDIYWFIEHIYGDLLKC